MAEPRPQNAEQAFLAAILQELRDMRQVLERIDWTLGKVEERGRVKKTPRPRESLPPGKERGT